LLTVTARGAGGGSAFQRCGPGRERVQRIVESRPFRSRDDLRPVEGFGGTLVDDLKQTGATLAGRTKRRAKENGGPEGPPSP
jgi:hypothetical protein